MDIKEYISSGIIESYILGWASESEVRELKLLSAAHPEIREAINAYEASLEDMALQNAVPPPTGLKQEIWEAIKESKGENTSSDLQTRQNSLSETSSSEKKNTYIIRYWIAAACAGLLISIGLNIGYRIKINKQSKALTQAEKVNQELSEEKNTLHAITASSVKTVVLKGIPAHAHTKATVYWDSTTQAVYLALNQLPKPAAGKQYQLWALLNGKPIDAGLYNFGSTVQVQKLKNIKIADMFAITLEPEGGSVSPTLSEMYVAGKL